MTEGFDNALFTELFAPKEGYWDFLSTALKAFEALSVQFDHFSLENEESNDEAIAYSAETVLVADSRSYSAVDFGEFVSEPNGFIYRAIAFATLKDENDPSGAERIYLRSESDDSWIMFDDQDGVYQTDIPHSEVVDFFASAILYKRIGDHPIVNENINLVLDQFKFKFDSKFPVLSAMLRLIQHSYRIVDQMNAQIFRKYDTFIGNLNLFSVNSKAFMKKYEFTKSTSMESILKALFDSWSVPVVMNQEDFKTICAKGALYFPKNEQPVGSGSFTTDVRVSEEDELQFGEFRSKG